METETGWEPALWKELTQTLGLAGLHVPEEYGGQGFGFVELGIALEETGRVLLCAPYFASAVLATSAIMTAASHAQKLALLPGLAAGDTIATLAFAEPNGRWDSTGIELTATPAGGAFRLDGVKSFVLDGQRADLIVVAARAPGSAAREFGVGSWIPMTTSRVACLGSISNPRMCIVPLVKVAETSTPEIVSNP